MSVSIHIPSPLRHECGGKATVDVSASTVRGALEHLAQSYPAVYRSVCDETDAVRPHINLFINWDLVPRQVGLDAKLQPGDEVTIMTAVSGG